MPNNETMIPMTELLEIGSRHQCNKELFPFVNRSLNVMGMKSVIYSTGDFIMFTVEHLDAKSS